MAYQQGPQGPQQWQPHPGQPYGPPPGYGYPPPRPPKKSNTGLIVFAVIGGICLVLFAGCATLVALSSGSTTGVVTATAPADTTVAEPQQQFTEQVQDQASEQAQQQPAEQQQEQTEGQGAPRPGKVGGTLTLQGNDPGVKVNVTVTKVVEKATPANEFLKPKSGNRYVAIELRIENKGQAVYSDAPSNGAKLIDDQGQQYNTTFSEIREGVLFSAVTVSPGDMRKGVVLYELPESVKLAKFQFALNSGFADQKGEWALT